MSTDDIYNEILKLAKELVSRDANLFKTAVVHIQDLTPREPSPVRRAAGAEQKGIQSNGGRKSSNTFHKYTLPGDKSSQEFYQCMDCGERRTTNSFHGDHQDKHHGQKFQVRWYCPMCNMYFAVTHRGYHIKNRHNGDKGQKRKHSGARYDDVSEQEEEYDDSDGCDPDRKRRRDSIEEDVTSQGSQGSPLRTLVAFKRQPSVVLSDSVPSAPLPLPPVNEGQASAQPSFSEPAVVQPPPPQRDQIEPITYQPGQFGPQPTLQTLQTSGILLETNMHPSSLGPELSSLSRPLERSPTEQALNGADSVSQQEPSTGTFKVSPTLEALGNTAGVFPERQTSSLSGSQSSLLFLTSSGDGTAPSAYFFPENKAIMVKDESDNKTA